MTRSLTTRLLAVVASALAVAAAAPAPAAAGDEAARTVLGGPTIFSASSLWCRFVGGGGTTATWPIVGDWNGDGVDGVGIVVDAGVGKLTWYLKERPGSGPPERMFQYGDAVDVPVAGDWDGDGRDGIGIVRQNGDHVQWRLRDRANAGPTDRVFDNGVWVIDVPIYGDWRGTGRDGIGNVHGDGDKLLWLLNDQPDGSREETSFHYGDPTRDFPQTADFDGDQHDEPAFLRATPGRTWQWHARDTLGAGPDDRVFEFGTFPSDCPVTGDWDGRRGDGMGVVRTTNHGIEWRLRSTPTTGPASQVFVFGKTPAP